VPDAPHTWRRYAISAGILVAGGTALLTVFALSGVYNVSAVKPHWDITAWLFEVIRHQSVRTQSLGIEPPQLDDSDRIRLGAVHFEIACADCHGAPGRPPSKLASAMLPEPPSLHFVADEWTDAQLFWIVHNGQKYTGMPAWPAFGRSDEVWSVVALLKKLPELDEADYRQLVGLDPPGAFMSFSGGTEESALCAACHGPPGGEPVSNRVPQLSGQYADYLVRSLEEYKSGQRPSGIMELIAADLSQQQIRNFASAYASASAPPKQPSEQQDTLLQRGALLSANGRPETDLPPCSSCHTETAESPFPKLTGQSATYIAQQLYVWRRGLRDRSPYGAMMSRVAQRLAPGDIEDVAAFLASLSPATKEAQP
jgi:cytochrome c553